MSEIDFSTLPLSPSLLYNLQELGMVAMTPIQAQSLPLILQNRDVIAKAKTGSGKTAAFGLGLLQQLQPKQFRVQALVICPTRELADQVAQALRRLARMEENTKILTLTGGRPFATQLDSLRHGTQIVVGTPGRLLKHLQKKSLSLASLQMLVLDEADRMLDMGFIEEIEQIVRHAPLQRQTLLFSATYPDEVQTLSTAVQHNAVSVEAEQMVEANTIEEYFYEVSPKEKQSALLQLFSHFQPDNVLLFCNTKQRVRAVAKALQQQGVDALALHGDLEQQQRSDVLIQFSNGSCAVLVATDVAARGLDIEQLCLVVNVDLPQDETLYTHRIGRTGRAGARGVAVTLVTGREALAAEVYQNGVRKFGAISELTGEGVVRPRATMRTLAIGGGKRDKIRPGDLLGALTGEARVDGKAVGKIDVVERQSYVAITREQAERACGRLKRGRIKKRKFPVRLL